MSEGMDRFEELLKRVDELLTEGLKSPSSRDRVAREVVKFFVRKQTRYRKGYSVEDVVDRALLGFLERGSTGRRACDVLEVENEEGQSLGYKKSQFYSRFENLDRFELMEVFNRIAALIMGKFTRMSKSKQVFFQTDETFPANIAPPSRKGRKGKTATERDTHSTLNKAGIEVQSVLPKDSQFKLSPYYSYEVDFLSATIDGQYFMAGLGFPGNKSALGALRVNEDARYTLRESLGAIPIVHSADARWGKDGESLAQLNKEFVELNMPWVTRTDVTGNIEFKQVGTKAESQQRRRNDDPNLQALHQHSVEAWNDKAIAWGRIGDKPGHPDTFLHVYWGKPYVKHRDKDIACYIVLKFIPKRPIKKGEDLRYGTVDDNMTCYAFLTSGPLHFQQGAKALNPAEQLYLANWTMKQYDERWSAEIMVKEFKAVFASAPSNQKMTWRLFRLLFWAMMKNLSNLFNRYDAMHSRRTRPRSSVSRLVSAIQLVVQLRRAIQDGILEEVLRRPDVRAALPFWARHPH